MRVSGTPNAAVAAVKALASLVLLAVLVVGVPLALAVATPMVWAEAGQDVLRVWETSQQDTGGLFLVLLTVVAWLAWAQFTCSVVLELPAQLKGRAARRRRGFGLSQGAAATLVGAVLVLLPTGTALAAPTTAVAVSVTATTGAEEAPPQEQQNRKSAGQHRMYVVQETHESLVSIAGEQLGNDGLFQEIADLNEGREMPDGTVYSPEMFLKKGWTLLLPNAPQPSADRGPSVMSADSKGSPRLLEEKASSATDPSASRTGEGGPKDERGVDEHTVEAGDTLWKISEQYYGDGARYGEVYDANRDTIDSPDLIYPGATLDVPQTSTPEEGREEDDQPQKQDQSEESGGIEDTERPGLEEPSEREGAGPDGETSERGEAPDPPPAEREDDTSGAEQPPPPAESSPAPAPSVEQREGGDASAPASAESEHDDGDVFPVVASGAALLAAGLLGTLYTLRVVQQRRRRRGRRIAMPEGRAARTEEELRAVTPPIEPALLDGLLRMAAAGLAAAGRELPELRAVVLGEEVELHLVEAAEAVHPFVAVDGGKRWVCPVTAAVDASAEEVDAPYPGLVVLGHQDEQRRLVLVDLEHVGVLQITGPGRYAVARSVAVETAVSQLAEDLMVVVPEDVVPGLAEVTHRVTAADCPADVLEGLRVHHVAQQKALHMVGLESLRQARLGDAGSGGWTPRVVITDDEWGIAEVERLGEMVAALPRSATAVVVTGEEALLPETGWVLHADGGQVRFPGGLECSLAALDEEMYADIMTVLSTADSGQDVPAAVPSEPVTCVDRAPAGGAPSLSAYEDSGVQPTDSGLGAALFTQLGDLDEGTDEHDARGEDELEGQAVEQQVDCPIEAATQGSTRGWPPYEEGAEPARPAEAESVVEEVTDEQSTPTLNLSKPQDSARSRPDPGATSSSSGTQQEPVTEEEPQRPPLVRVLGPVDVLGPVTDEEKKKRVPQATELTAWLLFHPGSTREALESALWRGRRVPTRKTVTQLISRTRAWLGVSPDGEHYFPSMSETKGAKYELLGSVSSDWHQFLDLVERGERTSGPEGTRALRQALELVRGTPFSGVPAHRYVWAEPLQQEMIAVLVDAAELLSERYQVAGEPRMALWAAAKGLDAAPEAEQLHRRRFIALHALGDMEGLQRAANELDDLNDDLGSEMEEDTLSTLHGLMSRA